ncbi:YceI family protein [Leptospira terpstrae]|uniref:YceI-like domain protein n=1 Tax=Leptospira terpstrae serovar Hualin str. LT 11-33 = ATCC 700639 TaxID=1257025 RepID=N1W1G7_9LEPT|nr:YceI family protein [Leptospira terpstrae]EMY62827.1 YceI-like domain protein [Leptospira terpstrae serovar Hualin str. LT 11-33 = ATCC 700639]
MKKNIIYLALLVLGVNIFPAEVTQKSIEFYVEHTTKNVKGVCGEIRLEEPNIQSSGNQFKLKSPFLITIPLVKISSGDSNRDSHIQEILGYPDTPNIIVKIESVNVLKDRTYTIQGKLTIHGNTKEFITESVVSPEDSKLINVDGSLNVKFSEYELENPSLLFMKAKDEIQIKYHFQIKLK